MDGAYGTDPTGSGGLSEGFFPRVIVGHCPVRFGMRTLTIVVMLMLLPTSLRADIWETFVRKAEASHGVVGARAARFLADHRPSRDAEIELDLLMSNLDLALRARATFTWARQLPEDRFHNDVLPYAVLDETRESWRPDLYERCAEIVAECKTAEEAAQAINRAIFNEINVHYNTGRKKPNQSLSESVAQGRATCTGLSIILVDACRAVGVPARIAGVANWADKRGNHTWVEIHDGSRWRFTGADEYDPNGLDRAWFLGDATRAVAGSEEHAVWATSWRRTGDHFPMAWNRGDTSVHAVDATERYVKEPDPAPPGVSLFVRVVETRGGDRVIASIETDGAGAVMTRAGNADMNDMPALVVTPGASATLRVTHQGVTRTMATEAPADGSRTVELVWDELAMDRDDANATKRRLVETMRRDPVYQERLRDREITHMGDSIRWLERRFGDRPAKGHSLWISLHGGGGTTSEVNDRQWNNHIKLYTPDEGICVVPRAPTDTWDMWHQQRVDPLLDRLIGAYVATGQVDPNRVYLMGYSAGGDGVYQLAPRLADRFGAAAMMAGHPNESQPLGLRNLPFAILMGGRDSAYNRNTVAREWGDRLDALRGADPDGYAHRTIIYDDLGHWMGGRDAEILPWLASHRRNAWPARIVWHQDDVTHTRFYWLAVAPENASPGATVRASIDGQAIEITSDDVDRVTLRLHDRLVDLNKPVIVSFNGEEVYRGTVARTEAAIARSLAERFDPVSAASALLTVRR